MGGFAFALIIIALVLVAGYPFIALVLVIRWQRRPPSTGIAYGAHFLLAAPMYVLFGGGYLAFGIYQAAQAGAAGGHLPWPLAQWALTTPAGMIALTLAVMLPLSPILLTLRDAGRTLHTARDVTGLPPEVWPKPTRRHSVDRRTPGERWLGRGRRARTLSLVAAGAAGLAVLAFFGLLVALVSLGPPDRRCGAGYCSPFYPAPAAVLVGLFLVMGLRFLGEYFWARRVEQQTGVRLRYRLSGQLYYIRGPGLTKADAAAALALCIPPRRPWARESALYVLIFAPLLALFVISIALLRWLPALWRP